MVTKGQNKSRIRRIVGGVLSGLLLVSVLVISAVPAGAAEVTFSCAGGAIDLPIDISATAPAEVAPGDSFDLVFTVAEIDVPASTMVGALNVTVNEITDAGVRFDVPANSSFNSVSQAGGSANTAGTTVTQSGGVVDTNIPGPFAGGASFTPPVITANLTATGSDGDSIVVRAKDLHLTADTSIIALDLQPGSDAGPCTPVDPNPVLATVQIANPPGVDAPNAIANSEEINEGESVDIDILADDDPNAQWGLNPCTASITAQPTSGTVELGEVADMGLCDPPVLETLQPDALLANVFTGGPIATYTPNAGFVGTDEFTYEVCSFATSPPVDSCDSAVVTISVLGTPEPTPTGGPGGGGNGGGNGSGGGGNGDDPDTVNPTAPSAVASAPAFTG